MCGAPHCLGPQFCHLEVVRLSASLCSHWNEWKLCSAGFNSAGAQTVQGQSRLTPLAECQSELPFQSLSQSHCVCRPPTLPVSGCPAVQCRLESLSNPPPGPIGQLSSCHQTQACPLAPALSDSVTHCFYCPRLEDNWGTRKLRCK